MLRKPQAIILSVVIVIVIVFGLMYLGILPGLRQRELRPVILNFWGVGDDSPVFGEILSDYQQLHPNVRINYRRFDENGYEQNILNALAANEKVDIIMFKNSWLPKHFDKIIPLPPSFAEASAGKAEVNFSFSDFQNLYPTVAIQDFAPEKVIYALPLYIDTLAMFYNRDIFDSKAIALPPKNWSEVQSLSKKIKIAMGASDRQIANASDLLNALFVQSGAPIVDQNFTRAQFAADGEGTLAFYTQFKYPSQQYSFDSFANGESAIIFGYHDQIKELLSRNPFLPLKIAPLPRPTASLQNINWARYYGLAVSRNSASPHEAWKFILFLAANPAESEKYLAHSGHPPALRSLINKKIDDPDMGVFAQQALSARSYPQIDDNFIRNIFSDMVESVTSGQLSPYSAVVRAESEITRLIQSRRK